MLGAAQADTLGAELAGHGRVAGRVGVGAHADCPVLVRPLHDLCERAAQLRMDRRDLAEHDLAGGAVQTDVVAGIDGLSGYGELLPGVVDMNVAATGHAALAHTAGDDGGVTGHAAAAGENALGRVHPADILGTRLGPHEDDLLAEVGGRLGLVRRKHDLADGRTGRRRQSLGHGVGLGAGLERRMEELVQLRGVDPHDGGLLADQLLPDHVDGDLDGGRRGPLARARLQEVQDAFLNRKLQILNVGVVTLELAADGEQLFVQLGHLLGQLLDRLRRADAGHHVLALGVGQILAVEHVLARGRVACEAHACGAVVAHVAEHHGLDVHRSAQQTPDAVELPVLDRAVVIPTAEDRVDGVPQKLHRVAWKRRSRFLLIELLVFVDDLRELVGRQLVVVLHARALLVRAQDVLELLVRDSHDHVAEHVDETSVRVPHESGVAGPCDHAGHDLVVESQVEHSVHHAGH